MDERKQKLLKVKIAIALLYELGRKPTPEEVDRFYLIAKILYKTVLGVHFERQNQKKNGQLAIF